jgi:cell division protein FtsL
MNTTLLKAYRTEFLLAASALFMSFALVWCNLERTGLAYEYRELHQRLEEAEVHVAKLEVERDNLVSPARLERLAARYGLKPPEADDIRTLSVKPWKSEGRRDREQ